MADRAQGASTACVVNMLLSECAWGRLEAGPQWVPVGRLATDRCAALAAHWLGLGSPVPARHREAAARLYVQGSAGWRRLWPPDSGLARAPWPSASAAWHAFSARHWCAPAWQKRLRCERALKPTVRPQLMLTDRCVQSSLTCRPTPGSGHGQARMQAGLGLGRECALQLVPAVLQRHACSGQEHARLIALSGVSAGRPATRSWLPRTEQDRCSHSNTRR